jgi:acyl transferase domain-containing protein
MGQRHLGGRRRRVSLPTYPFERQHYWMGRRRAAAEGAGTRASIRRGWGRQLVLCANVERTPFPREITHDALVEDASG